MKYDISHIMLCFMRVTSPPLSSSKPPANLQRSETGTGYRTTRMFLPFLNR